MYTPPAFRMDERTEIEAVIHASRLSTVITMTDQGLLATPLPLYLDPDEGEHGVLYGHLARANPQWQSPVTGEALAVFTGPDAYVTPAWYATKQETGKVVPTWNYVAVHAYGVPEFFEDAGPLLDVVSRLTQLYEHTRPMPWAVSDAPADFVKAQLRGIVGLRLPITRLEGKSKMSQNRNPTDRAGVRTGLSARADGADAAVAALIPS